MPKKATQATTNGPNTLSTTGADPSAYYPVTTIIYYSVTWVSPWGRNVYSQSGMISILWTTVINFNCIQQFSFDNYISIFDRIAILYYFSRLVKAPLFGFSFFFLSFYPLIASIGQPGNNLCLLDWLGIGAIYASYLFNNSFVFSSYIRVAFFLIQMINKCMTCFDVFIRICIACT